MAANWYDANAVDGYIPGHIQHPDDWYEHALDAIIPVFWERDWKSVGGDADCYNTAYILERLKLDTHGG